MNRMLFVDGMVTAVLLMVLPQVTKGQVTGDPPGSGLASTMVHLPIPRTIQEAEAEGARFPRSIEADPLRQPLLSRYPGPVERVCVRASEIEGPGLRIGDFAVGGGVKQLAATRGRKVWWAPLHDPAPSRSGLLVRAKRIDAAHVASDTMRMTSVNYAYPVGTPKPEAFFPTSLTLPSAGEWLIVATSSNSWGCVIASVEEADAAWLRRIQEFRVRPDTQAATTNLIL